MRLLIQIKFAFLSSEIDDKLNPRKEIQAAGTGINSTFMEI